MEIKRKKTNGNDADRSSTKPEKLKTDEPLAEKDEVKKAEETQRKNLQKTSSKFRD
ncbi:hypothetical protein [Pedobacter nutrimenti]|uniref:Uncharacterized protein n=1 Tax=Pedobacter nutrimenti TaxID=1241337 RepID=A0A318UNY8_9SPHI|nr:hypothetical protein [Pedobacter nutrimenti]PYF77431.1 hypothetical protein B0O44_101913 [Pedobacter nutrimenti]